MYSNELGPPVLMPMATTREAGPGTARRTFAGTCPGGLGSNRFAGLLVLAALIFWINYVAISPMFSLSTFSGLATKSNAPMCRALKVLLAPS